MALSLPKRVLKREPRACGRLSSSIEPAWHEVRATPDRPFQEEPNATNPGLIASSVGESKLRVELELELIQSQMAQKPMLRVALGVSSIRLGSIHLTWLLTQPA